uniref:Uncharacterized protein n=1 Tax=Aegilops tauschii subsp. strangulata TaxID=200361 RepID=A0A453LQ11_AEGTS
MIMTYPIPRHAMVFLCALFLEICLSFFMVPMSQDKRS